MIRRFLLLLALALALLLAVPGQAQALHAVRLRVDNDFFALRFTRPILDRDFTHGHELAFDFEGAPSTLRPLMARTGGALATTFQSRFALGQRIYTPRLEGPVPIPGERPFAGWLYLTGVVGSETPRHFRTLSAEAGFTGPLALGEEAQNGLHRLVGSRPHVGWQNQLPFEPAFSVVVEEGVRRLYASGTRRSADIRLRGGLGLGTLWTGSYLGLDGTASADLGAVTAAVEVGGRASWVWRDLFIDGTALQESLRAERVPLVAEAWGGATLRMGPWSGGARFVAQTIQYEAQPRAHLYGSFTVTRHF